MSDSAHRLIGLLVLILFAAAFNFILYSLGAPIAVCAILFAIQALMSALLIGGRAIR